MSAEWKVVGFLFQIFFFLFEFFPGFAEEGFGPLFWLFSLLALWLRIYYSFVHPFHSSAHSFPSLFTCECVCVEKRLEMKHFSTVWRLSLPKKNWISFSHTSQCLSLLNSNNFLAFSQSIFPGKLDFSLASIGIFNWFAAAGYLASWTVNWNSFFVALSNSYRRKKKLFSVDRWISGFLFKNRIGEMLKKILSCPRFKNN